MITLHDSSLQQGTTFTTSGRMVLDPHLASAQVSEEINGAFTLTLAWPLGALGMVAEGDIVATPVPGIGRQGFRITTLEATSDQLITATCTHITSDLASNVIVDRAAVNRTASEALAYLLSSLSAPHPFTAGPATSMGYRTTARWVRKTGLEALVDDEVGLLSRWGGEIIRDNTRITWVSARGRDRGASVWEGKNLTGLTVTRDTTSLATRILPVGFDGLTLPEVFVDSPRITDYPHPYIRVMSFEQIKAAKDPANPGEGELPRDEALAALRDAARALFDVEHVDQPALVIEAEMAPDQVGLEQVLIGDRVTVHADAYGLQASARITGYTFNPLTGTYESLTLATHPSVVAARTLTGQIKALTAHAATRAEDTAMALISANGSNTVYYQADEPAGARLGDTWFQDVGDGAVAIWVYQTTTTGEPGWVQVAGDITAAAISAELAHTRTEIAQISTDLGGRITQMNSEFDAEVASVRTDMQAGFDQAVQQAQALEEDINSAISQVRADFQAGDAANGQAVHDLSARVDDAIAKARADFGDKDKELTDRINQMDTDFDAAYQALEGEVDGKVGAGGVIAAINASPEVELIAGKRLHVTGQALIDTAVIKTSMIADAAITNAKIGAVDAAKITTGYLDAARIKAASISSDKLSIAAGFITTAMIADTAITSAKIASLDAAKITSGYISAARIAASSITSDKLSIAAGFITTAMIADAAITSAKVASLDAGKITTGTLSAARIGAGSITSDKLTIAAGFIKTAMIADAAITSAKIGSLDAGKITTGTLSAARIGSRSITADKLASNAIQVGLAGWSNTIRITPYSISWYDGSTLEGQITSQGMAFWYGTRKIGRIGEQYKKDYPDVRGITNALEHTGDFVDWAYKASSTATVFTTMLTLDPKGKFWGQSGIHLGSSLRTHGWAFYTAGNRSITLQDVTLNGLGTFPGWSSSNNLAKIAFHTYDVMVVTNGSYYNMTRLFDRVKDLMSRVNALISLLNQGWIKTIRDAGGGRVTWEYYSNTGWQTMSTSLT
ncbi:peptidase [Corynebacterium sp. 209RC1]|uniref:phage tail spike protein n=1 Tax=Corynebacterium sp. 209RC1 TaxID=2968467 RepID=UPI00211B8E96|nr:phage tail spike protein [Corynebacterium sp. 209RC1]MCQ9352970.1 peptidase [Corynebacterium sp. 209RC1]